MEKFIKYVVVSVVLILALLTALSEAGNISFGRVFWPIAGIMLLVSFWVYLVCYLIHGLLSYIGCIPSHNRRKRMYNELYHSLEEVERVAKKVKTFKAKMENTSIIDVFDEYNRLRDDCVLLYNKIEVCEKEVHRYNDNYLSDSDDLSRVIQCNFSVMKGNVSALLVILADAVIPKTTK